MAVSSMTGYGRADLSTPELAVTVEARSSNNRFLDISLKLPQEFASFEPGARRSIQSRFHRGRIEVVVAAQRVDRGEPRLRANLSLARAYVARLRELAAGVNLPAEVTLPVILQCPGVLTLEGEALPAKADSLLHAALDRALATLQAMRVGEGEVLHAELLRHLLTLEESGELIEKRLPDALQRYQERLRGRVRQLAQGLSASDERLAMEVAIAAERSDVSEELLRLRSHIAQFREQLSSRGSVGRSLDFLIQEMHREVNTIGAKANDLEITRSVIVAKGAVEKLREQVQNVE